jgi:hypothetical protein
MRLMDFDSTKKYFANSSAYHGKLKLTEVNHGLLSQKVGGFYGSNFGFAQFHLDLLSRLGELYLAKNHFTNATPDEYQLQVS